SDEATARSRLASLLAEPGPEGWQRALGAMDSGRDPELAAKLLGEAVAQDRIPDQLQAWLAFGGLAQRLAQPALASRIVDAVIARFPDEPRVALLHASQLRESGKPEEARALLAGLEAKAAGDAELRFLVAGEYDALGDAVAAARVLGQ